MANRSAKINPREKIFADTGAFIALLVQRDELHQSAIEVMQELSAKNARLLTTESVLFELANALSSVKFRAQAIALIDELRTLPNVEIVWADAELFKDALTLYRERPDKEWSLTDCYSFIVMEENKIHTAFTSDKHFEQAGFVKLLGK
jgi:uncharacterized protein